MNILRRFWSWYSETFRKQKLIGKMAIGCGSIFILFFICSLPIAIISPTTPTSESGIASVNETPPMVDKVAESTVLPTSTILPTETPLPTSTPIPTDTPDPNLVDQGTYIVGADIAPGIYKGFAGESFFDSCYWERLKDLTGSLDAILANDNSIGQFYIEVKDDDYALSTACQLLRLETIPEHVGEYPQVISAGTYLVGSDIKPGTYRGQAGADFSTSCYWERLRDVAGGLSSILANDNANGQYYIQVLPGDFALKTACELEWVKD